MKKCIISFIVAGLVLTLYADEQNTEGKVTPQKKFTTVTAKKFTFSYRIDEDNLVAKVSCPTKGWVAVGFDPVKKMKGANFIIGCNDNGNQIIVDNYGVKPIKHKADTLIGGKDDIIESSCFEENSITTLSFTIPLDSGDDKDVVINPGKEIKVIFAAGKKDNLKTKHTMLAKAMITF